MYRMAGVLVVLQLLVGSIVWGATYSADQHSASSESVLDSGETDVRLLPATTDTDVDGFDYPVGSGWTYWHGFEDYNQVFSNTYHAGEDWCTGSNGVCDGESAEEPVYAIGAGIVKYAADSNYPGGVIIIEHTLPDEETWYSIYSHVNVNVSVDQAVSRGEEIATIYDQAGNSHLHFEIRNFYIRNEVNGEDAACGSRHSNYPPGPGYWPMCSVSSGKPTDMGWVNPSQFIDASTTARFPYGIMIR
jgi:murein DD-endopeptidase MepM/ murein hydrolase activator NlpD